jgi:hypothetical protein
MNYNPSIEKKKEKMDMIFLQDSSFVALENQAFKAIQRIFPCEEDLLDKVPLNQIIQHFQSQIIFQKNSNFVV